MDIEKFKNAIELSVNEKHRAAILDSIIKMVPMEQPIQMRRLRERLKNDSR